MKCNEYMNINIQLAEKTRGSLPLSIMAFRSCALVSLVAAQAGPWARNPEYRGS